MSQVIYEVPTKVLRHLMPHEVAVFAVKRHPIILARYVAELVLALALAIWLSLSLSRGSLLAIWILWLIVVGRCLLYFWSWTANYFIVSSQRMILASGVTTLRVASVPLVKVADMRVERSIPGRIFGYGEFRFESVSGDHTFSRIRHIPAPDELYLGLMELIFPDPDA